MLKGFALISLLLSVGVASAQEEVFVESNDDTLLLDSSLTDGWTKQKLDYRI
jgi:hypothetical protein